MQWGLTRLALQAARRIGFKLEAQDLPKSRPKPQKIDVEKQHIFNIDFWRVRTSFWEAQNLKNWVLASTRAWFLKNRCLPKICEKTWILSPFWEAKILNFRIFLHIFWKQISNNVLEAKKFEKNVELDGSYPLLALDSGHPQAPGERKREGIKGLGLHNDQDLSDSQSVIELGNWLRATGLCV